MASFEPQVDEEARTPPRESPGRRLRRARERRQLTTVLVADALHLERRMVEALESDDYQSLPPAIFVRGYLRAYARYVEVPEEEIVGAFDQLGLDQARPLTGSVGNTKRPAPGRSRLLPFVAAAVVVAVAAVAASGWFLWSRKEALPLASLLPGYGSAEEETAVETGPAPEEPSEPDTEPSRASGAGEQAPAAELAENLPPATEGDGGDARTGLDATVDVGEEMETPVADGAGEVGLPSVSAGDIEPELESRQGVTGRSREPLTSPGWEGRPDEPDTSGERNAEELSPSGSSTLPVDRQGPDAVADPDRTAGPVSDGTVPDDPSGAESSIGAARTDGPDAVTPGNGSAVPGGTGETLRFRFAGESWMEVTDARGERLIFGLVTEAGVREVSGLPPFTVVIGDVDSVSLARDGESVDLSDHTHGRVARFTLEAD